MKSAEYLQQKIDYFKNFRYLHTDATHNRKLESEEVVIACDKAIEHLEKVIEDLEEEDDIRDMPHNLNKELEDSQK